MSRPNFVMELQSRGIGVGDVIEIVTKADSLDLTIQKQLNKEKEPWEEKQIRYSNGLLVEITGMGEQCILGIVLQGSPIVEF